MKTNQQFRKMSKDETEENGSQEAPVATDPDFGPSDQQASGQNMFPAGIVKTEPIIEDIMFQQHMLQMKHQQFIQQQLLEEHYQKNRQMLQSQHEKQLGAFLQQLEQQRKREEIAKERENQFRLDVLKQKDKTCESAVASPEVKRRLQEVILQRKRREAAASMGNLQIGIPVSTPPQQPTALLRKVQSESNLLKIKTKRDRNSAPYSRVFNHQLQLVPESVAVSGSEASTPSPISQNSLSSQHSIASQSALPAHQNRLSSSSVESSGSTPASPQSYVVECKSSPLGTSPINSRSLPNIPSSLETLRRSPPAPPTAMRPPFNHRRNPLEKSHSYAILPLRKHLMQKSMAERKSMDDNQYYYQKNKLERERLTKPRLIRPLEEVMEEDQSSPPIGSLQQSPSSSTRNMEEMEIEDPRRVVQGFNKESPLMNKKTYFTPFVGVGTSGISPLVLSDPRVSVSSQRRPISPEQQKNLKTGIAFNSAMLKHQCLCENTRHHPENPERLQFILARLMDTGLLRDCEQVSMLGTLEQIQSCHTEAHTLMFGTDVINRKSLVGQDLDGTLNKLTVLPCGGPGVDSDTYWNELHTSNAARFAVGSVVELVEKIASNKLQNGFGIVRPPGHHAEAEEAMGFCYFNTVAIAAKQILKNPEMRKILIVDWAIHHGNGTQKFFYDDPRVLYISIHRHDNGNFYPGTGGSIECGAGTGLGTNVNIAWSGGLEPPMGDAEYLAAFRTIVMPIAREFDPDFVLVSAGFDAAQGHEHPIGGYTVSPACFAYLTHQLLSLAGGKVALVLEGGYSLDVLCDSVEQCCRALMGHPIEKIIHEELARRPCQNAVDTIQKTMAIHCQYWNNLSSYADRVVLSHFESWGKEKEDTEALSAMASLSMQHTQRK